jgi:hypothetical protein
MRDKLPVLFEGHAPVSLHQAFEAALAALETWSIGDDEPHVDLDSHALPISVVFGRMRSCTDLLPVRLQNDVEAVTGQPLPPVDGAITYASAAQILRSMCIEQLKAHLPNAGALSAATINAARISRERIER